MPDPAPLTLKLERSVSAPASRVFEAFTDGSLLAQWWGPVGFSVPSLDFHPRPGEGYCINMQPPEGEVLLSFGESDHGTEVVLEQGPLRTEARRELHRDGWSDSFDRLEQLLSRA